MWLVCDITSHIQWWVDKLMTHPFVCGVHLLLRTVGLSECSLVVFFLSFFWCVCLYIAHFIASISPLQSPKQLKQQQEEKTNKASVKHRLNQNKFNVSLGVQCCTTDAHAGRKTQISLLNWGLAEKVNQESIIKWLPVLDTVVSSSPATDYSWSNHSLAHYISTYLLIKQLK